MEKLQINNPRIKNTGDVFDGLYYEDESGSTVFIPKFMIQAYAAALGDLYENLAGLAREIEKEAA